MKNNKKILISSVIGTAALVLLVFGATYAFFAVVGANNTYNTSITANTASSGGGVTATTASFNFDVSLENMSVSKAGNIAGISDTGNIVVTATAPEGVIMTCTYNIDFEWKSSEHYTEYSNPSEIRTIEHYADPNDPDDENLLVDDDTLPEFFLGVLGDSGDGEDNFFGNFNLTKVSKVNHIVESASITVYGGRKNARRWNVLSGIYNLPVNQNSIAGKNYSFDLSVTDVNCEFEPIGNNEYNPQVGDLFEINDEPFYYFGNDGTNDLLVGANPLYADIDPDNLGHYIVRQSNEAYAPTKIAWFNTNDASIYDGHITTESYLPINTYKLSEFDSPINTILSDYGSLLGYPVTLHKVSMQNIFFDNLIETMGFYPQNGWTDEGYITHDYFHRTHTVGLIFNIVGDFMDYDIPLNSEHYIYPVVYVDIEDLI